MEELYKIYGKLMVEYEIIQIKISEVKKQINEELGKPKAEENGNGVK